MPKETNIKQGDKVEARWPTTRLYYPAVVLKVRENSYKVEFEDGTKSTVKPTEVKILSEPVVKPKRAVRSRSRSGGRHKTERAKSKSPTRKTTAAKPEKKHVPLKSKNSETKLLKNKQIDEVDISAESSNEVKYSDDVSSKATTSHSNSMMEKMKYSSVVLHDLIGDQNSLNLRTSARIAALQVTKAATSMDEQINDKQNKIKLQSELMREKLGSRDVVDGDSEEESDEEEPSKPQKKFSFLSCFAVLFKVFFLPLYLLYFCSACTKKKYTIYEISAPYNRWKEFENDVKIPFLLCFLFHLSLCLLSKIPVGKLCSEYGPVPHGRPARKYRLNGFYLLLLYITIFGAVLYFDFHFATWPAKRIKGLVISALCYTTLLSIMVNLYGILKKYIPSDQRPFHQSGFVGDFYYGREVNPWLFEFEDIKTRLIQFGLIGLVLMNLSVVSNSFFVNHYITIQLALAASMQLLFVLDFFWREECMLTSATYTDDGVGYGFILGIGSVIPGLFVLQTHFLSNSDKTTHIPHWCSVAITTLFVLGLLIYDYAMKQKNSFRRAPFSSAMSKVTSIPTSKQRRLITSGLWKLVRHPNHLGLLIMVIACSLPCGFTHVLPYMPLLFFVMLLVLRSLKLDRNCQMKYGPAWQNYTEIARKRIIPYIF